MSSPVAVLNLKCPNCGAALQITPDIDRFACGYCGVEQIVHRSGGIVSLKLVTDAIKQVQIGTDRTAAELTLRRYQDELQSWQAERDRVFFSYSDRGATPGLIAILLGAAFFFAIITGVFLSNVIRIVFEFQDIVALQTTITVCFIIVFVGTVLYLSWTVNKRLEQKRQAQLQPIDNNIAALRIKIQETRQRAEGL